MHLSDFTTLMMTDVESNCRDCQYCSTIPRIGSSLVVFALLLSYPGETISLGRCLRLIYCLGQLVISMMEVRNFFKLRELKQWVQQYYFTINYSWLLIFYLIFQLMISPVV